jgi:hypothetical protein
MILFSAICRKIGLHNLRNMLLPKTVSYFILKPVHFPPKRYIKYMPELEWKYAYLFFWIVVSVVLIAMVGWFKRKKWF